MIYLAEREKGKIMEEIKTFLKRESKLQIHVPYGFRKVCDCLFEIKDRQPNYAKGNVVIRGTSDRYFCPECHTEFERDGVSC